MFSTIGTLVANSVVSVSLLSPIEAIAASTVLVFSLGGLGVLAWLTREPVPSQAEKSGSHPRFRKAA